MSNQYLAQHLQDYASVARELEQEIGCYGLYMQLFMKYLGEYLAEEAEIDAVPASLGELPAECHVAYQEMGGDAELVVCIMAEAPVFLEFARRYSGEPLRFIDALAVDSIEEFLNVVNGFFSVKMAALGKEIDLEPPQYVRDVEPMGSHLLILRLRMGFGSFYVLLSTDLVFGEE